MISEPISIRISSKILIEISDFGAFESIEKQPQFISKPVNLALIKAIKKTTNRAEIVKELPFFNNPNTKKSPRIFKGDEDQVTGPNQVWVSDLTYLPTGSGFS